MFTQKVYSIPQMAWWTRFETIKFILIITAWVSLYHFLELEWIRIPWTPLALIGTAVAFVVGFQNNSVYSRIWEARKIWGGIVNTSRTLGVYTQDMITNEHAVNKKTDDELKEEVRKITYRHIAWLTTLRYAMRADRPWETTGKSRSNTEWGIKPQEMMTELTESLKPYLSKEDMEDIMAKGNHSTALLYQQSHHFRKLKEEGCLWEFSFLEMEALIKQLFDLQGKSERIKNFPYPRQYATLNHYFMWLLLLFLPLALIPQFADIGKEMTESFPILSKYFVWFTIPIYSTLAWIFHTMERIGRTGENPFEGTANDVPISTIARGIEIDLRQNLGEKKEDIPAPFPAEMGVQF